jgi:hypothetical protein
MPRRSLRLIETNGRSVQRVAHDLGIAKSTLSHWRSRLCDVTRKKYQDDGCRIARDTRQCRGILTYQEARSEPRDLCRGECGTFGEDKRVPPHARVRAFLESVAKRRILITYQELANALQILPPHSIHRVTEALERLMEEDAAADRPFIAALAISKARGGLPGPGFFDCARRLGRFAGDPNGQDARTFHAAELNAVFACWGGSGDN